MSQVRGRCVICTSTFVKNNIAALQCGHTFHYDCVQKWIERSKTCPNCRIYTTERQIVKHLFFDAPDEFDTTQNLSSNADAQVEALLIALEKEKSAHFGVQEEVRKLKDSNSSLQSKLDTAEARYRKKVPSLEARNCQLEMMLVNQKELEKTLEKTKSRLRACEFYRAVTAGKNEEAIDKYIKDDGSIELAQFLNILRRQVEEGRRQQIALTDELRHEREQHRHSKKKENDLKNLVQALKRELRDVRAATNMSTSTPFNPKLKKLGLDESPQKRCSLGFDETIDLNDAFVSSVLKQRRKPVSVREEPKPKCSHALFVDSSDDEDARSAADVSLQYPSSLDKIPSPVVPKTLRDRVLAGSMYGGHNGIGNAHRAAEKALENLELRNIATSRTVRRPLLKRKNENCPTNPRLSQFFQKKQKSNEVIALDD